MKQANPPTRMTQRCRRDRRRGVAYVMVLSTGVLLSVIGLSLLAASRGVTQASSAAADLAEAGTLAEAAVHWGIAALKADNAWRTSYTHNVETAPKPFGRGTMTFKLVDETDGNLANNQADAVKIVGVGRCGSAVRMYSVGTTASGPSLEVLKAATHVGGNFTINSSISAVGGPISSNGTVTIASGVTVTGDVEASSITGAGSATGSKTTLPSAKAMPSTAVFDTYKGQATEILFSSIPSGLIDRKLFSKSNNPYGTANASGVYYIKVPANSTLTLRTSRVVATLVVELADGARFNTTSSFSWEPPRSDFPALVVKGGTGGGVTLASTTTALSEMGTFTNFNPAGTPNTSGATDTDTSDSYPSEVNGLVHMIGTGYTTTLGGNLTLKGLALIEGNAQASTGVKLTASPAMFSTPPSGYSAVSELLPAPKTWKWEQQ